MGTAVAVLAVFAVVGLGCPKSQPTDIHQIKVPRGFDYSTTQDVTVKVTVVDFDGNVSPSTEVIVGSTENELVPSNVFVRGVTDDQGQFERVVRVPARLEALRIQASIVGISNLTDASIQNNEVSVSFGPQS